MGLCIFVYKHLIVLFILNSCLDASITLGIILMNKELAFSFLDGTIQKGCIIIYIRFYINKQIHMYFTGSYMVGLAIVVLVFGYTLSIFRMKYQGYPYR